MVVDSPGGDRLARGGLGMAVLVRVGVDVLLGWTQVPVVWLKFREVVVHQRADGGEAQGKCQQDYPEFDRDRVHERGLYHTPPALPLLCYSSTARAAATVSMSLSPRPLSPTTMVWSLDSVGASLDTW
mgnify:CR=1 FL=1